jgi:biopolymer transport protein TolR
MRAHSYTVVQAQPNVTPMIDVMLVLLIIFMSVAPMLDAGFRLVPPAGSHLAQHPDDAGDAVIGIDARGALYFNKRPVSEPELRARLRDRFAWNPGDRVVYLRADATLSYDTVQSTMELAASEGAQVVGLVSVAPATPRRR